MPDLRHPNALPEGTEIGGYLIGKVLGQGGFGITYEATSATGFSKKVAIKEFFPRGHASRHGATVEVHSDIDRSAYEAVLKRFEAEARKLIEIYEHPNIVKGENFIRARGSAFIIMEYVDGLTLQDWLRRRDDMPSEAELRPLLTQVLDAVDYLHDLGGIHRDLSPKNIMIRERRRGREVVEPVLIDFGALGEGLDIVRDGSTVVTANPGYAPPEQLHPQMHAQGRYTDIFALGGVLYYCVTGRSPERPADRLAATWKGGPSADPYTPAARAVVDPSRYSRSFLAAIDACLALNVTGRPQTVTELKRALGWMPRVVPEDDELDEADDEPGTQRVERDADLTTIGQDRTVPDVQIPPRKGRPGRPPVEDPSPPLPRPEPPRRGAALGPIITVAVILAAIVGFWQLGGFGLFRGGGGGETRTISPFTLTAAIAPDGITLDGFAPSDSDRDRLVQAATRAAGRVPVTNRLQVAAGAPSGFVDAATSALGRVGDLVDGRIAFRDLSVQVDGTARTPEAYLAAKRAFAVPPPGGTVSEAIRPATASPYNWSADVSGGGVTLNGYVPSEAARRSLIDAAQRGAGGRPPQDRMLLANGAPSGFVEGATALLGRLGDIADGRIALADNGFRVEGTARTPDTLVTLRVFLANALPGGLRATEALRAPGAPPTGAYRWTAELAGRGLTLTGTVPDDDTRRAMTAAARSAVGTTATIDDRTTVAAGAPQGFANATRFALDIIARLRQGKVEIADGQINVEGTPRSADDERAVRTALTSRVPAGFRLGRQALGPPDGATPPAVAAATQCDRLALPPDYPEKPTGIAGVAYSAIDPDPAIAACEQAIAQFPTARRLQVAYGQALAKKRRYADARTAYQKAADAGDGRGLGYLGWLYRDGLGVDRSLPRAAEFFEKGADLNDRFSIPELAILLHDGAGNRPRDQARAYALFQRGAALGSPVALHYVGFYLQNGLGGAPTDATKALENYRRAADLGYAPSLYQVGIFYQKGLGGLRADMREALRWFERAADAGSDVAAYNTAYAYDKGFGTDVDGEKAARFLLAADRRGQTDARQAFEARLQDWNVDTVKGVKRILRDAGLYRGFIDEEYDQPTRSAVEAYRLRG